MALSARDIKSCALSSLPVSMYVLMSTFFFGWVQQIKSCAQSSYHVCADVQLHFFWFCFERDKYSYAWSRFLVCVDDEYLFFERVGVLCECARVCFGRAWGIITYRTYIKSCALSSLPFSMYVLISTCYFWESMLCVCESAHVCVYVCVCVCVLKSMFCFDLNIADNRKHEQHLDKQS